MGGHAAEIEDAVRIGRRKRVRERLADGGAPIAFERQDTPKDRNERFGRKGAARVWNRQAGPLQSPNACDLVLRVTDELGVDGLLGLKRRVHTLGWNDGLSLVAENEGRVLAVEDHDIDLLAEIPLAIDDMGCRCLIALRQIFLQELKPDGLARIALRSGMPERFPLGQQLLLDVVVQTGKKLGQ